MEITINKFIRRKIVEHIQDIINDDDWYVSFDEQWLNICSSPTQTDSALEFNVLSELKSMGFELEMIIVNPSEIIISFETKQIRGGD